MKECSLYEVKDKEKKIVRCLACAHKCLIKDKETGICGVRKNEGGKLMLLVYEKVASMHVDPIEKKPLYDFLPKTDTFSIGTVGCNFRCDFCQNFDISQASKSGVYLGKQVRAEEIVDRAIEEDCQSISYTYNEPIIFVEFIKEIAELARKKGLKNIMVSNGFWSRESFDYISDLIDAVNIDLKGGEDFYKRLCGGRLHPVLDTIKRCYEKGIHVEITTLLIPEVNDSDEELEEIAKFISGIDKKIIWHISRFFPMYKMIDKDITDKKSLKRAKEIGERYLDNVYLGNV